jgi:hypothetical protein
VGLSSGYPPYISHSLNLKSTKTTFYISSSLVLFAVSGRRPVGVASHESTPSPGSRPDGTRKPTSRYFSMDQDYSGGIFKQSIGG